MLLLLLLLLLPSFKVSHSSGAFSTIGWAEALLLIHHHPLMCLNTATNPPPAAAVAAVLLLLAAAPTEFRATTKGAPLHNMYYSAELAPGVLTLHISAYLASDSYAEQSPQFIWFKEQLKKVGGTTAIAVLCIMSLMVHIGVTHRALLGGEEGEC